MARPPIRIGDYGTIQVTADGGKFVARASFRGRDGRLRPVRRWRATGPKAVDALKQAMLLLAEETTTGAVKPTTRFGVVADLALAELDEKAALGDLSPNTVRTYRGALKNWARPALDHLQIGRELTVDSVERVVSGARAKASYDTAHTVKSAVSVVCRYAVRKGALGADPTKSIDRMRTDGDRDIEALTFEQRTDLLAKLRELGARKSAETDAKGRSMTKRAQIFRDLPDIMEAMLSTGERLGELLAHDGDNVTLAEGKNPQIEITHHLVRITGQGLTRRAKRKSGKPALVLAVPQWSVPMWRRRKLASGGGPLFGSYVIDEETGQPKWLDPSNTIGKIKDAMAEVGYGWVTSHIWRKTVATVIDDAGLPTTAIADQLGNTRAVAEKHYRKPRAANQQQAEALENMFRKAP